MTFLFLILLLLSAFVAHNSYKLISNYVKARKIGLPLVIVPIDPNSIPWMIISVPLRPVFRRFLPPFIFDRLQMTSYGWEHHAKYQPFEKWGPSFILVTCGSNELWTADPEHATEILKRPRDYNQSIMGNIVMRLFGENLLTTDGEDWSRQRRLIAPTFNERISDTVFRESCRQAEEMLDYYVNDLDGISPDMADGFKTIAINVLGAAGYGIPRPWRGEEQTPAPGYKMTYMEATRLTIDHIVEAAVLPTKVLTLPFMPKVLRDVGISVLEFPIHTRNMLENERNLRARSPADRNTLMSQLVKLADQNTEEKTTSQFKGLSEDEVNGNLFVFTAAGFDSTANTMTYAMTLLAAYPQWQDWLIEELDAILPHPQIKPGYAEIFPKLQRCLCLMYETVRLFTPVVHLAKTNLEQTTLQSHVFPARTSVYVNSSAIHTDPKTWGPDALLFRPTRWLVPSENNNSTIFTPPRGTFLPWSAGPRICPGAKMAQVEFIAVFATVFRRYRVEAVKISPDETPEQVTQRVESLLADSQSKLTLQMNRPEEVRLRWVKRV